MIQIKIIFLFIMGIILLFPFLYIASYAQDYSNITSLTTFPLINGSISMSVDEVNQPNTTITLPIPSNAPRSAKYVFLYLSGSQLYSSSLLLFTVNISIGNKFFKEDFTTFDFSPQLNKIINFDSVDASTNPVVQLTLILTSRSKYGKNAELSVKFDKLDLYMITPPILIPICVPTNYFETNTMLTLNGQEFTYYFTMFLPSNTSFDLVIKTSIDIRIKTVHLDDANWVNIQNDYPFTNRTKLHFVTDPEHDYMRPKTLTLTIQLSWVQPFNLTILGQQADFVTTSYLPTLSNEDNTLIYGITIGSIILPLGKLIQDRRKKSILKYKR
ncbi:MAG: hypothetical protein ACFFD1_10230 [Candidatus Thorarchaeota archaeon]